VSLSDRYGGWALVTGASSGLGEHFAEALAEQGFPLVLTARREDRLHALAERLSQAHGVETLVVPLDLTLADAAERLLAAVGEREVGVLVNNAGFGFSGRFSDQPAERDVRMVAVNCAAPVALTHAFLPGMLRRKRGAIVVVASVAGFQPTPFFAVYGATKAFDLALAEALADELRGSGVDVLALCPGETETEFAEHAHFGRGPGGMKPRPVVDAALRGLGRKHVVVPGALNKISAFLHRLLPRRWVAAATGKVLAKELLRTTATELRHKPYGD
jgi:short-subunit dehydrogenase